jgi:hypothetical protein
MWGLWMRFCVAEHDVECHGVGVPSALDVDYLVVGAGAMGMAFTDALVGHSDAKVALVDRRHGVGGHWLDAYPFVRLHQASAFYGVPSTLLGGGRVQTQGPETGLHERATAPEICAYYGQVLAERLLPTGQVEVLTSCEVVGDREVVSRVSGQRYEVPERCRVVDARYLSPSIPALTPPPFEVDDGARVIPVNDLVRLEEAPSQYVVIGAGKTATDACIWLLAQGVDPDAICWVRPRDPWMLNRAMVQPNPAVFFGMVADILAAGEAAESAEDLFLRLEDLGIMLRVDRSVLPTMAKAPTLATWELDELRTLENVVRQGHVRRASAGALTFEGGSVAVAGDAVVVHCAASGLKYPPRVPIWGPDAIRLQAIRAGFPCFGAALAGYVEATRDDDAEKNRLCPPTPYPNTMTDWIVMNVLGVRATTSFGAEPDIKAWTDTVPLNPARVPPEHVGSPEVAAALSRMMEHGASGTARLAQISGLA